MTNKEAIEILPVARLCIKGNPNVVDEEFNRYSEALDKAIEALEKQVPKRLKNMGGWYACPACFKPITNMECDAKYPAHSCGQLVIWEDNNDK